jgi:hypothetical protein
MKTPSERLASFRIEGPVCAHIVDGVSKSGDVVGPTLLPGVDVAEPAPGAQRARELELSSFLDIAL